MSSKILRERCSHIFKGGRRDGEQCVTYCKSGNSKCSRHKNSKGRVKPKDEPKEQEEPKEEQKEQPMQPITEQPQFEVKEDETILTQIRVDINKIKWRSLSSKTFDLRKNFGRSIAVFGSSYSGKTQLLRQLIDLYAKKDMITLLQADNIHAEVYKGLPKYILKTDEFKPEIIESWKTINSKYHKKNKFRFMSITDDIVTGMQHNNTLRRLILSFRNSNINSIGVFQSVTGIINKPERGSINYIILKNQNDMLSVKDLIEWYLNQSPLFQKYKKMEHKQLLFKELMRDKSNNIVIDNIKGQVLFIKNYI